MNRASSNKQKTKRKGNEDDLYFAMTLRKFRMIVCSLSLLQVPFKKKDYELFFAITLKRLKFE